jgi:hypothetical protein
VADGLQVVASGLLVADVRVERGVAGGAGQVLTFFEGDVFALRVLEALGETEVDDVDVVFGGLGGADEEVVRLDVAVDDALLVNLLDAQDLHIQ